MLLGLAMLLSGCLKYDLTLVINQDDTMDGTLITAVAREFATGQDIFAQSGDLTPSQGSVTKEPYEDADYVGSRYVISDVPIAEIDALSSDNSTRFQLTREGDEYVLDASVNFNLGGADSVPADSSFSAMVSMTFPGEVLESNGAIDGNTVMWTQLRPDAANSLTARASAIANGEAGSGADSGIAWWVWAIGAAGLLIVIGLLTALLLRSRRAARSAAAGTAAEAGAWPASQQGWYDANGAWVPAPAAHGQSGYDDAGQDGGGYDSYYGTHDTYGSYGGSGSDPYDSYGTGYGGSGDSYGGPPGTEPYPQTGPPASGYTGQTVVSYPGQTPPPPQPWSPRTPN